MGDRVDASLESGPARPDNTASDGCPPDRDAFCGDSETDSLALGEVQLILAEKRTALAVLRSGIAVFVLPLSVFSFLIAFSKHYQVEDVLHLFILVVAVCLGLVGLGAYLVIRSVMRMHRYDLMITRIKRKHSRISEFLA